MLRIRVSMKFTNEPLASVRDMIRHFHTIWGTDRGASGCLRRLFPSGGPQKQGNRLAGLLRTKGEH